MSKLRDDSCCLHLERYHYRITTQTWPVLTTPHNRHNNFVSNCVRYYGMLMLLSKYDFHNHFSNLIAKLPTFE